MNVRAAWLSLLIVCCLPASARAFCQATTVQAPLSCPQVCVRDGRALAWQNPEIEYAFNVNGFAGLDQEALRAAIAASFAAWHDVDCHGRPLGFHFSALAASTDLTVGPLETEPNLNVISWLDATTWQQLGFSPSEFAHTKVWFDEATGEILGADIAFNGAMAMLSICPDSTTCTADSIDLQNVATHEIGHFLGLAHSEVAEATMWCSAQRGDHEKRSLADDDVTAMCDVYDDGQALRRVADAGVDLAATDSHGGCSVSAVHGRDRFAWHVLALLSLLLVCRRGARVTTAPRSTPSQTSCG